MSFKLKLLTSLSFLTLSSFSLHAFETLEPVDTILRQDHLQSASTNKTESKNDISLDAQQNYWGFGVGYAFNKIPISLSTFDVLLSNLWYSHVFGNPEEKTRIAGTLGLYGFALVLPIPRVSMDFYYGKPSDDIQFKTGVGGFYDLTVAGHGGLSGELGVVLKNRVDISFIAVPVGTDSKRSYGEFLGLESKTEADQGYADKGHYIEFPYYGLMVGLRF